MKRVISTILIAGSIVTAGMPAAAAAEQGRLKFSKVQTYAENQFSDISPTAWYYADVAGAYEYGLMQGTSADQFDPDGEISVASVITIAARIHVAYNGKENVSFNASAGEEWYAPYVRYAESVGILSKDLFAGQYERCATRYEVVKILSSTLPGSELSNQNPYLSEIADMKPTDTGYATILKAVKSGIITGRTEEGDFYPNDPITRAEISTILMRIIDPSRRISAVRSIYPQLLDEQEYDTTEYYVENEKVKNYGAFNNIPSLFRGYSADSALDEKNPSYSAVYCYSYDPAEYAAYMDSVRITPALQESNSIYSTYKIGGYCQAILFPNYNVMFFKVSCSSVSMLRIYKEDSAATFLAAPEREPYDLSNTYPENPNILNFGSHSGLDSVTRENIYGERLVSTKYTYRLFPISMLSYCQTLSSTTYAYDAQASDFNPLFMSIVFTKTGEGSITVYADFIAKTMSVEFEKTQNAK